MGWSRKYLSRTDARPARLPPKPVMSDSSSSGTTLARYLLSASLPGLTAESFREDSRGYQNIPTRRITWESSKTRWLERPSRLRWCRRSDDDISTCRPNPIRTGEDFQRRIRRSAGGRLPCRPAPHGIALEMIKVLKMPASCIRRLRRLGHEDRRTLLPAMQDPGSGFH
jgi:hypothetical protein